MNVKSDGTGFIDRLTGICDVYFPPQNNKLAWDGAKFYVSGANTPGIGYFPRFLSDNIAAGSRTWYGQSTENVSRVLDNVTVDYSKEFDALLTIINSDKLDPKEVPGLIARLLKLQAILKTFNIGIQNILGTLEQEKKDFLDVSEKRFISTMDQKIRELAKILIDKYVVFEAKSSTGPVHLPIGFNMPSIGSSEMLEKVYSARDRQVIPISFEEIEEYFLKNLDLNNFNMAIAICERNPLISDKIKNRCVEFAKQNVFQLISPRYEEALGYLIHASGEYREIFESRMNLGCTIWLRNIQGNPNTNAISETIQSCKFLNRLVATQDLNIINLSKVIELIIDKHLTFLNDPDLGNDFQMMLIGFIRSITGGRRNSERIWLKCLKISLSYRLPQLEKSCKNFFMRNLTSESSFQKLIEQFSSQLSAENFNAVCFLLRQHPSDKLKDLCVSFAKRNLPGLLSDEYENALVFLIHNDKEFKTLFVEKLSDYFSNSLLVNIRKGNSQGVSIKDAIKVSDLTNRIVSVTDLDIPNLTGITEALIDKYDYLLEEPGLKKDFQDLLIHFLPTVVVNDTVSLEKKLRFLKLAFDKVPEAKRNDEHLFPFLETGQELFKSRSFLNFINDALNSLSSSGQTGEFIHFLKSFIELESEAHAIDDKMLHPIFDSVNENIRKMPADNVFSDTDLIVFKDSYSGLLPINGIKESEFNKLCVLYDNVCKNQTYIHLINSSKESDRVIKTLLTREIGRKLIAKCALDKTFAVRILFGENLTGYSPDSKMVIAQASLNAKIFADSPDGFRRSRESSIEIAIAHELIHHLHHCAGTAESNVLAKPVFEKDYDSLEEQATITGRYKKFEIEDFISSDQRRLLDEYFEAGRDVKDILESLSPESANVYDEFSEWAITAAFATSKNALFPRFGHALAKSADKIDESLIRYLIDNKLIFDLVDSIVNVEAVDHVTWGVLKPWINELIWASEDSEHAWYPALRNLKVSERIGPLLEKRKAYISLKENAYAGMKMRPVPVDVIDMWQGREIEGF